MAKMTIRDVDLQGKTCLVRVDFNVPLRSVDGVQTITDETRIRETLPTIGALLGAGAKVVLCSHLGRPKGRPNPDFSLAPVADRLSGILGVPVEFSEDCVGDGARSKIGALAPGGVLLLENVRFHAEEEANDPDFAARLAEGVDVFVNDAFGSAHRAHASTEGVTHHVPVSVAGLLMEKELKFLQDELAEPARPFVVVLGGAKVSDKISVIDSLLDKADTILVGGAMAYTFALALGKTVGSSLSEPDKVPTAKAALAKAEAKGVKFLLPADNVIVQELDFQAGSVSAPEVTGADGNIPDGWEGVDIGPATVALFNSEIAGAKTIVWNGPMGIFEIPACSKGTFAIAEAVAANQNATTIIGGGDSVKAVKQAGFGDRVTFISTGGGASLELLEGKVLPGVAALTARD